MGDGDEVRTADFGKVTCGTVVIGKTKTVKP